MTDATSVDSPRTTTVAVEKPARNGLRKALTSLPAIIFYGALLVLWELASQFGWVRSFILPGPSLIAQSIALNWDSLWSNTLVTAREILIGFLVGSLLGFILALGIFYSKPLRTIIYPGVVFLQTVPKVALAPLFLIWFGVGESSIVAITALICLFPILVNTVVGFEGVDVNLLELMHSVSANGWQKFRMIYLPASLPEIFAGLEVGMSLAVVGAIVGEFIGARAGLGYQILMANSRIDTAEVFAAIVFISAVGMLFYFGVRLLGRLLVGTRANTRTARESA
ncbi:ABC transporter permease [Microbacterium pseudoresistens]|uniref:NitT/TauT family transport system permease protein n=1 Tax=Microbacterium pseudoresistens TaxID=640634 RepID=A0A7Y9EVK8_9MICO|nr:ABC transporter permease [Microbacterium pseudoresistens]NYD54626.1 NitT/TauT family transport system permease protein [Microbacterium pseudoresistens]